MYSRQYAMNVRLNSKFTISEKVIGDMWEEYDSFDFRSFMGRGPTVKPTLTRMARRPNSLIDLVDEFNRRENVYKNLSGKI